MANRGRFVYANDSSKWLKAKGGGGVGDLDTKTKKKRSVETGVVEFCGS